MGGGVGAVTAASSFGDLYQDIRSNHEVRRGDFLFILVATAFVLAAEAFDSAIEALCDFVETLPLTVAAGLAPVHTTGRANTSLPAIHSAGSGCVVEIKAEAPMQPVPST